MAAQRSAAPYLTCTGRLNILTGTFRASAWEAAGIWWPFRAPSWAKGGGAALSGAAAFTVVPRTIWHGSGTPIGVEPDAQGPLVDQAAHESRHRTDRSRETRRWVRRRTSGRSPVLVRPIPSNGQSGEKSLTE